MREINTKQQQLVRGGSIISHILFGIGGACAGGFVVMHAYDKKATFALVETVCTRVRNFCNRILNLPRLKGMFENPTS